LALAPAFDERAFAPAAFPAVFAAAFGAVFAAGAGFLGVALAEVFGVAVVTAFVAFADFRAAAGFTAPLAEAFGVGDAVVTAFVAFAVVFAGAFVAGGAFAAALAGVFAGAGLAVATAGFLIGAAFAAVTAFFVVGADALARPEGAFLSVAAGPAVGRFVVVATVTSSSGRPSRPTG
jgi:hypothetical protein